MKQIAWSWENERKLLIAMGGLVVVVTLLWVFIIGPLWLAGGALWFVGLLDLALYSYTIWNTVKLYRDFSRYRA